MSFKILQHSQNSSSNSWWGGIFRIVYAKGIRHSDCIICDTPLKVPPRPLPFSPLRLLLPKPNVGRQKNLWPLRRVLWEVHATGTQWPARPSPVNSMLGPPLLSAWPQPLQWPLPSPPEDPRSAGWHHYGTGWRDGGKECGGGVLSTPRPTSLVRSSPSKMAATISCLCFRCTEDHFTALSRCQCILLYCVIVSTALHVRDFLLQTDGTTSCTHAT